MKKVFLLLGIIMITSPSLVFAADIKSSDDNNNEEKQSSDNDKSSSEDKQSNDDRSNEEKQSSNSDHDDCDKIRPGWNKNYYANKCRHDND
jgi:5'-3' exonuclease